MGVGEGELRREQVAGQVFISGPDSAKKREGLRDSRGFATKSANHERAAPSN